MSFVIYSLIGLMPGDPIDAMIASNPGATPEVVAHLRAIYGLDQPLLLRYCALADGRAAAATSAIRAPALRSRCWRCWSPRYWQTCQLIFLSFTLAVILSFALGIIAALRARRHRSTAWSACSPSPAFRCRCSGSR